MVRMHARKRWRYRLLGNLLLGCVDRRSDLDIRNCSSGTGSVLALLRAPVVRIRLAVCGVDFASALFASTDRLLEHETTVRVDYFRLVRVVLIALLELRSQ